MFQKIPFGRDVGNIHVVPPVSTCFNRETNAKTQTNRRNKSVNLLLKMPRKINESSGLVIFQLNVEGITRWRICDFKTESVTLCYHLPSPDTVINTCYSVFQRKLLDVAKRTNPVGFCNFYIPGWDPTCEVLQNDLDKAQPIPDK